MRIIITCSQHYSFNGVCETRLFVLVLRARSSCFTHGVREVRACADQFTSRTLLVELCAKYALLPISLSCPWLVNFILVKYGHNHCSSSFAHYVKKKCSIHVGGASDRCTNVFVARATNHTHARITRFAHLYRNVLFFNSVCEIPLLLPVYSGRSARFAHCAKWLLCILGRKTRQFSTTHTIYKQA